MIDLIGEIKSPQHRIRLLHLNRIRNKSNWSCHLYEWFPCYDVVRQQWRKQKQLSLR
ncbi:hypothetical protein Hanom_Chr17g01561411 [Helianthus anomalus]